MKYSINFQSGYKDWNVSAKKTMNGIVCLAADRNIVSHSVFMPVGSDHVKFLSVKARTKLKFKEIVWSISDFEERYSQAGEIRDLLAEIVGLLDPIAGVLAAFNALSGVAYDNGSKVPK